MNNNDYSRKDSHPVLKNTQKYEETLTTQDKD